MHRPKMFSETLRACGLALTVLPISGCAVFLDDDDEKKNGDFNDTHYDYPHYSYENYAYDFSYSDGLKETECAEDDVEYISGDGDRVCFEGPDTQWETTCERDECIKVAVNVFYLLDKDLGRSNSVVVEAFDNPHFAGSPESSARLTGFDASAPGRRGKVDLYLDGELYYFRAYVAQDGSEALPYEYSGMQLVSDRPVGTYGALSELQSLDLRSLYGDEPASIDIYLDKLFKAAGDEEPSEAYLRLLLNLPEGYKPPLDRLVRIELHEQEDFAFKPAHVFSVPTENFLVEGRTGKAEFLSPQLPEGKYFLYAYLDASGNEFADAGEPQQTYYGFGEPARVEIIARRTASLSLELAVHETAVIGQASMLRRQPARGAFAAR